MFKKFINKLVSLFPDKIQKIYYQYEEVLMYLFFGVLTTAVSFITAGLSKKVLEFAELGTDYVSVFSTVFSWICAVTFAYVTNRIWVFSLSLIHI